MMGDPVRQDFFRNLPRSKREHNCRRLLLAGIEINAVKTKKDDHGRQCRSLVAVDERMIACNTESIGCGEHCKLGLTISELVDRSRQSGFKKSTVADAVGAA